MEVAVKQALVECTAIFTVCIATDQPPCADYKPNTLILANRPRNTKNISFLQGEEHSQDIIRQ